MKHDEILPHEVLEQAPQPESNRACSDLIPSPDDGLAPIPPECREAWAVVEERVGHHTRTFKGLRYLLAGYSYRESARERCVAKGPSGVAAVRKPFASQPGVRYPIRARTAEKETWACRLSSEPWPKSGKTGRRRSSTSD